MSERDLPIETTEAEAEGEPAETPNASDEETEGTVEDPDF